MMDEMMDKKNVRTILSEQADARSRLEELERLTQLYDAWLQELYGRIGMPYPGNEPRESVRAAGR